MSTGKYKSASSDATYQHSLVRRLFEAQLSDASTDHKRLMAEAATELEASLPATDAFVNKMRAGHTKVLRKDKP